VNTPSTFNIYVTWLVLRWLKEQGGVAAMEAVNEVKAKTVYDVIDASGFYKGVVQPAHRSRMNVTFHLPTQELLEQFLKGAGKAGLSALKGYRDVGGVRASIYNAMPLEGAQALAAYMKEFERTNG
jgi:phosphoserine aminotransferase